MIGTISILVVNPNSSEAMTFKMKETILSLDFPNTKYAFFTAPDRSPKSIDSEDDAALSAKICLPLLEPLISQHDGVLVACYSQHPLVTQLRSTTTNRTYVMGIFEASITTALNLLVPDPDSRFGIVTTGKAWEETLSRGVRQLLTGKKDVEGNPPSGLERRFVGVQSTGLTARELHDLDEKEVKERIRRSTFELLCKGGSLDVGVVCLGCAGMTGFEDAVRSGIDDYEEGAVERVRVVDAVKAGVVVLQGLIRARF